METLVSLTSHGYRLGFVHIVLEDLVKACEGRNMRTVLSVQEDEVFRLSQESNDLIASGKVELITVKKDYGPATKQIPCRLRYPDAEMIVVDDDVRIDVRGFDAIVRYRKDYPRSVLGFRARRIEVENGKLRPFIGFIWSDADKYSTELLQGGDIKDPIVLPDCFFEHVGVVAYPPKYAVLSEEEWRAMVEKAPYDDDVVMQVVSIRHGFETVLLPGRCTSDHIDVHHPLIGPDNLYGKSGNGARTAKAMEQFSDDFIKYVTK